MVYTRIDTSPSEFKKNKNINSIKLKINSIKFYFLKNLDYLGSDKTLNKINPSEFINLNVNLKKVNFSGQKRIYLRKDKIASSDVSQKVRKVH